MCEKNVFTGFTFSECLDVYGAASSGWFLHVSMHFAFSPHALASTLFPKPETIFLECRRPRDSKTCFSLVKHSLAH